MTNTPINSALNYQKTAIIFGVPLFMVVVMVLIARSSLFLTGPNMLATGITFDLLITTPLVYFLLIRKTRIPRTTVILFLILGMVVGSIILPTENQYFLNLFKAWVFPIIELSIISHVIYQVSKAVKQYQTNANETADFYTTLKNTCYEILPKGVVMPVVTEIAVFYYGFIQWRKRKLNPNEFSYHKESGTVGLLVAIIFLVVLETVVFHILLVKWSSIAAWILSFLSVYSGIQLFGFLKSLYQRPISIEHDRLLLRYGMVSETTIDLKNIESIEVSSKDLEWNQETRKLSFLGELESHNVIIRLKEENMLHGLYGIKRSYKNLALHVDQKMEFCERINRALRQFDEVTKPQRV